MSELLSDPQKRLEALCNFARKLIAGESGKQHFNETRHLTATVTPAEAMQVLDRMLNEGIPFEAVKANTGKIMNVFFQSLRSYEWEKPPQRHFLSLLMAENRAVENLMHSLRELNRLYFAKETTNRSECLEKMSAVLSRLKLYELHYLKKENILFPYIEKYFSAYRCLQLMWSFHDDFRRSLKTLETLLGGQPDDGILSNEMGKLFFVVHPIIFREEQVIFPVCLQAIPESDWKAMLLQAQETGWCYLESLKEETGSAKLPEPGNGPDGLGTGSLRIEQIRWLLNTLPLDVTFIDENDEVRYFSGGKHRIFPRSPAILGRKVQNCHPHESVHVVNEIVQAFRSGKRDHADFHIQMKGQFIHIRYFAVRDEKGAYKGTLEVSQDVTEIRSLEGEKRLLEWMI